MQSLHALTVNAKLLVVERGNFYGRGVKGPLAMGNCQERQEFASAYET